MGGGGGVALPFLTTTVDGGVWLASRTDRFITRVESQNPLYKRLNESQSRSTLYGEKEILLALPGIKSRLLGRPASILVAMPTEISRLPVITEQASQMICRLVSNSVPQAVITRIWKRSKLAEGFTGLVPDFLSQALASESRSSVTSPLQRSCSSVPYENVRDRKSVV